jgi:hypothetical protein
MPKLTKQVVIDRISSLKSEGMFWRYINEKDVWKVWSNDKLFSRSERDRYIKDVKRRGRER